MQILIKNIKKLLIGGIIGIANIIPGVSGGTMALVLGIYERLITAIHNISFNTVRIFFGLFSFKKRAFNNFIEECKRVDAPFLLVLVIGALCAILPLSHIMKYLLTVMHDPTYGFFFGLVLVSVLVPLGMIKKKDYKTLICALLAIGIIYGSDTLALQKKIENIKQTQQVQNSSHTIDTEKPGRPSPSAPANGYSVIRVLFILLLGAVTISAMILPGISGSFLLLLLGGYYEVIQALANKDLTFIAVFASGCLLGIVSFSRLLNYLLKSWHDQTMGFLTGLVVGSLWVIWPFKQMHPKPDGTVEFLHNTMPDTFSANEAVTLITAAAGILVVLTMIFIEKRQGQDVRT